MPFRWRFRSLGRHGAAGHGLARAGRRRRRCAWSASRCGSPTARPSPTDPGATPPPSWRRASTVRWPARWPSGRWCCCATRPCSPRALPRPRQPPPPTSGRPSCPSTPTGCSRWPCSAGWPAVPVTGDRGSSHVRARGVVTILDGLRAAGERFVINVAHHPGDDLDAARLAAGAADVAVVVVGYTHRDEGENVPGRGGDRRSLTLHAEDEALIRTAAAANPRTVVVLVGGSAIVTESWRAQVGALIMAWYPGIEGGHRPRPPAVRRGRARRPPALHLAARRRAAAAVRPRRRARALRPAARLPADGGDGSVARLPVRVRPDLHDVRARPSGGEASRGRHRAPDRPRRQHGRAHGRRGGAGLPGRGAGDRAAAAADAAGVPPGDGGAGRAGQRGVRAGARRPGPHPAARPTARSASTSAATPTPRATARSRRSREGDQEPDATSASALGLASGSASGRAAQAAGDLAHRDPRRRRHAVTGRQLLAQPVRDPPHDRRQQQHQEPERPQDGVDRQPERGRQHVGRPGEEAAPRRR